jgi:hypothetical protein
LVVPTRVARVVADFALDHDALLRQHAHLPRGAGTLVAAPHCRAWQIMHATS